MGAMNTILEFLSGDPSQGRGTSEDLHLLPWGWELTQIWPGKAEQLITQQILCVGQSMCPSALTAAGRVQGRAGSSPAQRGREADT